jgi:hypothetical protein
MRLSLLGVFAAIPSIGSVCLPPISVHHRKHLRTSAHQSDSRALASPPTETPGTLGAGLVIQQGDRMCMFQAWRRVGVGIRDSADLINGNSRNS